MGLDDCLEYIADDELVEVSSCSKAIMVSVSGCVFVTLPCLAGLCVKNGNYLGQVIELFCFCR